MKDKMVISNIFLVLPVTISILKNEWVFFLFSFGVIIASPYYHYLKDFKPNSKLLPIAREFDWVLVSLAYIYMFYFIYNKIDQNLHMILYLCLLSTLILFFYGFKFRKDKYTKLHPWFHFFGQTIAGLIVYLS